MRETIREIGTVAALLDADARIVGKGTLFMLDICNQCGSSVSKKLLRCSDGTAVFHRECSNGHKLHRTTGEDQQAADSYQSASYVIIEACDCG